MDECRGPPDDTRRTKSVGRRDLFLVNLPIGFTQQEMADLVSKHGQVDRWSFSGEGSAFIQMRSNSEAEFLVEKLDGHLLKGHELRVRFAVHGIRLKELSAFVSNELLFKAFSAFGAVRRAIHVVDERGRPSGEGIVEFDTEQEARRACRQISDGSFFLTDNLQPISAEIFDARDETDGLSEEMLQKSTDYFRERGKDAHFAAPGGFEADCGRRWKELRTEENRRRGFLEKALKAARERLATELQQKHHTYLQGGLEQAPLEHMEVDEVDWTPETRTDTQQHHMENTRKESAASIAKESEGSGSAFARELEAAVNRAYTGGSEEGPTLPTITDEQAENFAQNQLFLDEAFRSWVNRPSDATPSTLFREKLGIIGASLSRETTPQTDRPSFGRPIRSPKPIRRVLFLGDVPLQISSDSSLSSGRKRRSTCEETEIAPKRRSDGSFSGDSSNSSPDESASRASFADASVIHTPSPVNTPSPIVNTPPNAVNTPPPASPINRPASPIVLKSVENLWEAATLRTAAASKRGKGALHRLRNAIPMELMPLPTATDEGGLRCPHPHCARRRRDYKGLRGLRGHMTNMHQDSCGRCWLRFEDRDTRVMHQGTKCARRPVCPDRDCGARCNRGFVSHLLTGPHHHQQ